MKPIYGQFAAALALTFGLAACIPPAPEPTPAPSPTPVVTPAPAPQKVPQAPVYDNWIDVPQTPGNWQYSDLGDATQAYFGDSSDFQRALAFRCIRASRMIEIGRPAASNTANSMTIRTETATRTLPAGPGRIASPASSVATLAANDPLLDAIALTRGRFAVESPGMPTLYVPAWAEVTRVIEDCR